MRRGIRILFFAFLGVAAHLLASPGQQRNDCQQVFTEVQRGLVSGSVKSFSHYFGSQVNVNLRGGESGYYSANQTFYLLESYLKTRKVSNLTFSTVEDSAATPFATGSATLSYRGSRDLAQVYIALKPSGNHWVITQINIY